MAHFYPPFNFHLWDLLESHRYDEARALVARFDDLIGGWIAKSNEVSGPLPLDESRDDDDGPATASHDANQSRRARRLEGPIASDRR